MDVVPSGRTAQSFTVEIGLSTVLRASSNRPGRNDCDQFELVPGGAYAPCGGARLDGSCCGGARGACGRYLAAAPPPGSRTIAGVEGRTLMSFGGDPRFVEEGRTGVRRACARQGCRSNEPPRRSRRGGCMLEPEIGATPRRQPEEAMSEDAENRGGAPVRKPTRGAEDTGGT